MLNNQSRKDMSEIKKKSQRFTFKTVKPTGRWKSFDSDEHNIKFKGEEIGWIESEKPYKVHLHVIKDDINSDGNPNCMWKSIKFKPEFESLQEAKEWLNKGVEIILSKYTLATQENQDKKQEEVNNMNNKENNIENENGFEDNNKVIEGIKKQSQIKAENLEYNKEYKIGKGDCTYTYRGIMDNGGKLLFWQREDGVVIDNISISISDFNKEMSESTTLIQKQNKIKKQSQDEDYLGKKVIYNLDGNLRNGKIIEVKYDFSQKYDKDVRFLIIKFDDGGSLQTTEDSKDLKILGLKKQSQDEGGPIDMVGSEEEIPMDEEGDLGGDMGDLGGGDLGGGGLDDMGGEPGGMEEQGQPMPDIDWDNMFIEHLDDLDKMRRNDEDFDIDYSKMT